MVEVQRQDQAANLYSDKFVEHNDVNSSDADSDADDNIATQAQGNEEESKVLDAQPEKKRKLVKRQPMTVNTTAARSDLALLQALIEKYGWKEFHIRETKADVIWQFPGHETESK